MPNLRETLAKANKPRTSTHTIIANNNKRNDSLFSESPQQNIVKPRVTLMSNVVGTTTVSAPVNAVQDTYIIGSKTYAITRVNSNARVPGSTKTIAVGSSGPWKKITNGGYEFINTLDGVTAKFVVPTRDVNAALLSSLIASGVTAFFTPDGASWNVGNDLPMSQHINASFHPVNEYLFKIVINQSEDTEDVESSVPEPDAQPAVTAYVGGRNSAGQLRARLQQRALQARRRENNEPTDANPPTTSSHVHVSPRDVPRSIVIKGDPRLQRTHAKSPKEDSPVQKCVGNQSVTNSTTIKTPTSPVPILYDAPRRVVKHTPGCIPTIEDGPCWQQDDGELVNKYSPNGDGLCGSGSLDLIFNQKWDYKGKNALLDESPLLSEIYPYGLSGKREYMSLESVVQMIEVFGYTTCRRPNGIPFDVNDDVRLAGDSSRTIVIFFAEGGSPNIGHYVFGVTKSFVPICLEPGVTLPADYYDIRSLSDRKPLPAFKLRPDAVGNSVVPIVPHPTCGHTQSFGIPQPFLYRLCRSIRSMKIPDGVDTTKLSSHLSTHFGVETDLSKVDANGEALHNCSLVSDVSTLVPCVGMLAACEVLSHVELNAVYAAICNVHGPILVDLDLLGSLDTYHSALSDDLSLSQDSLYGSRYGFPVDPDNCAVNVEAVIHEEDESSDVCSTSGVEKDEASAGEGDVIISKEQDDEEVHPDCSVVSQKEDQHARLPSNGDSGFGEDIEGDAIATGSESRVHDEMSETDDDEVIVTADSYDTSSGHPGLTVDHSFDTPDSRGFNWGTKTPKLSELPLAQVGNGKTDDHSQGVSVFIRLIPGGIGLCHTTKDVDPNRCIRISAHDFAVISCRPASDTAVNAFKLLVIKNALNGQIPHCVNGVPDS
jgi:hypothetical protein